MSPCRRGLRAFAVVLGGIAVTIVVSPATGVRARVIVDEDARTYTITAPIDLVGGEDGIAEKWNKAIRDYWNDGPLLGRFKYCGKSVEFSPDIKPIAAGQPGRPDAAKIRMHLVAEGQPFISNVRGLDPTRNSTGVWAYDESDATIAHEFGHILGLVDEYVWVPYTDSDGNGHWDAGEPVNDDLDHDGERDPGEPTHPAPGNEGSIMAEARGTALQRHIDAALRAMRGLTCWKGRASIDSSAVYPEEAKICSANWQLEFMFAASRGGTISGLGTADRTSVIQDCFIVAPTDDVTWQHVDYQVLGDGDGGGFSLRFATMSAEPAGTGDPVGFGALGLEPLARIAVSGTSGTGQGMWQFQSGPWTMSASGTVTLECVDCEEAVG